MKDLNSDQYWPDEPRQEQQAFRYIRVARLSGKKSSHSNYFEYIEISYTNENLTDTLLVVG